MANETNEDQQQSQGNSGQGPDEPGQGQGQCLVKGYRKKGLSCEKVLVERLSDISLDDSLNPVITLSSVEVEGERERKREGEAGGEGEGKNRRKAFAARGPLKATLSLDVPSMNLDQEAKRPPL